jgi:hypothetical protein
MRMVPLIGSHTSSRLGQFTQIWMANVTTDENSVIEVEFMWNAFAVFGIGSRFVIEFVCDC